MNLLSMIRKEIKEKSNNNKIIFYTFKTLNIYNLQKKKIIIICLTSTPGTLLKNDTNFHTSTSHR
jgi:hypothetical protein